MPRRLELAIRSPLARPDLPGLCARLRALLDGGDVDVVLCDVRGAHPDAVLVDALARLRLTAREHGCELRVRNAGGELRDLVALCGLEDVLPAD